MGRFKKATRKQSRLRFGIDGPPGSGKSYTALRVAFAFASVLGRQPRVAAIDTEHGSLSKYTGESPDGEGPFEFDCETLTRHSPSEYTALIEEAGRSGYDVLVIDSLSHAWEGVEGALELVDKSKSENRFTAWKDVTPMHRRMVEAILASPCHVIVTMRSKVEHVLEPNDKGKMVPRKIGMRPIQREGMEYEFDLFGSMDTSHILSISKSRCRAVDGAVVVKPGASWVAPVLAWLSDGEPVEVSADAFTPRADDAALQQLVQAAGRAGVSLEALQDECFKHASTRDLGLLSPADLAQMTKRMEQRAKAAKAKEVMAAATGANPATTAAPATTPSATTPTQAQIDEIRALRTEYYTLANPDATPEEIGKLWLSLLAERWQAQSATAMQPRQIKELTDYLRSQITAIGMRQDLEAGDVALAERMAATQPQSGEQQEVKPPPKVARRPATKGVAGGAGAAGGAGVAVAS